MDPANPGSTSTTLLRQVGDPKNMEAWWEFCNRYRPAIFYWCLARGLQPADANEVTTSVLTKLETVLREFEYDPQGSFRCWLWLIVYREVVDFHRRRKKRPGDYGAGGTPVLKNLDQIKAPEPTELMQDVTDEQEQNSQMMRQAMNRVRSSLRKQGQQVTWKAFWLSFVRRQKAAKVAAKLGMKNPQQVYTATYRVKQELEKTFWAINSKA